MSLYKYLPPERIDDVLKNATLAASRSAERNDPFDELVVPDWDTSDAELRRQWEERGLQIPYREYADFQRAQKVAKRGEVAMRLRAAQDEKFGGICFSKVWDSIPMWSYYAREHRGFVIEFDETHPAFANRFGDGLVPIYYGSRVIVGGKLERGGPLPMHVKAPAWSHEQEMRIVVKLEECRLLTGGERHVYLASYPREIVTRVILGCRFCPRQKDFVRQNLRGWGFRDAKLIVLEPQHGDFGFVSEELALPESGT